jgi:hypothetical protein
VNYGRRWVTWKVWKVWECFAVSESLEGTDLVGYIGGIDE